MNATHPPKMFMPLEGVEMTGCDPVQPELHIDSRAFRDDTYRDIYGFGRFDTIPRKPGDYLRLELPPSFVLNELQHF